MTFKPKGNSKNCISDKQNDYSGTQNGSKQCNNTIHISTIYDPQLQCMQSTLPATPPEYSSININQIQYPTSVVCDPKKAFIKKIKETTLKFYLYSSADQDLAESQKRMRFIKLISLSILLICKLVLMTTILIVLFRNVQKPEIKNIIVEGEYQILNQKFEYEMLDRNSQAFKELASNLTSELDRLFRKSNVGEYFQHSEIVEITPNMTVKCVVVFRSGDYMNVGRIGLEFLRSLRLQHGHTYLGVHTINVQSIGFQIRGEEGEWGEWSDWKGCDSLKDTVATRTRNCLTKDTFQQTNLDRCLLTPGNKGDLEIMPCREYRAMLQRNDLYDFTQPFPKNLYEREKPLLIPTDEDNASIRS